MAVAERTTVVTATLPIATVEQLDQLAEERSTSRADVIREACELLTDAPTFAAHAALRLAGRAAS